MDKPSALKPHFGTMPAELITLPQWVLWKLERRGGNWTKPPFSTNGQLAKTNNPLTWATFESVKHHALNGGGYDGVGFCLSEGDGLTALDLDHCVDRDTMAITQPEAAEIVQRFVGTRIERSPSGDGLRIWCFGKAKRSGKAPGRAWIECYTHPSNRYLTVTGHHWTGSAASVTDQQAALDWLHETFMAKRDVPTAKKERRPASDDDSDLIERIRKSRQGPKFDALMSGDAGDDHSAADLALCNILAFWCDRDPDRIDRIFRASGLMREKWDRKHHSDGTTYGAATVQRAIQDCTTSSAAACDAYPRSNLTPAAEIFSESKEASQASLPALPRVSSVISEDSSVTSVTQTTSNPPSSVEIGFLTFEQEDGKRKNTIESKAALVLAEEMRDRFSYCVKAAAWHRFTGTHWAPEPAAPAERFVSEFLYRGTDPIGFRPAYMAGVVKIMLAGDMIPLPRQAAGKIPFRNGLLDMTTGQIEAITPANAATWVIPHDYVAGARCPVFATWLKMATNEDGGLVNLIRAFVNACLTGRSDLQKFLHIVGPGGTGKSTFIRLLFAMLGPENCVTTDLRQLEQNRFETSCLYGKRLAAVTDSDRYGGAVNVLKAITGQDPIRNERKHEQQSGTFIYQGMVLIASNEHLAATDYTSGLERRRLVIELDKRITAQERARFKEAGGEDRLHAEIPAVIAWALRMPADAVTHAFLNPPAKALSSGLEALTAQNPIAEWITESLVPDPQGWVQIGACVKSVVEGKTYFDQANFHLYPNYCRWCLESNRTALSARRFRDSAVDMLRTMGADAQPVRRGCGRGVAGIRFLEPNEAPYDWQP